MPNKYEIAVFGAGCFWCYEPIYEKFPGVVRVTPGYAGGYTENPTYEEVCKGTTGHAEVVEVVFDPKIVKFDKLVEIFWTIHDPTSLNRQGNDIGTQYRSIILYTNEKQKKVIERSIKRIEEEKVFSRPIVTEIKKFMKFYSAEDYHRNYCYNNSDQQYCQLIILPKIEKFEKTFLK